MNAEYSVYIDMPQKLTAILYIYNTLFNSKLNIIVLISFVHPASTD